MNAGDEMLEPVIGGESQLVDGALAKIKIAFGNLRPASQSAKYANTAKLVSRLDAVIGEDFFAR